ncbi:MAG: PhnD/SsuA/transferrin family substrate-binding protein, partial [Rhodocyclaceae bacterium]
MQKRLERPCHFRVFEDFEECRQALRRDEIDLIYANPYDAALLLREKGFLPVAKPQSQSDEAVIAAAENAPWTKIEDLGPGLRFASAGDPEVDMICKIMLEPADLTVDPAQLEHCDNYVVVAKEVLNGSADIGFFGARAFDDLSSAVRKRLRILVRSQIFVLHHMLLISPRAAALHARLRQILVSQSSDIADQRLLA